MLFDYYFFTIHDVQTLSGSAEALTVQVEEGVRILTAIIELRRLDGGSHLVVEV